MVPRDEGRPASSNGARGNQRSANVKTALAACSPCHCRRAVAKATGCPGPVDRWRSPPSSARPEDQLRWHDAPEAGERAVKGASLAAQRRVCPGRRQGFAQNAAAARSSTSAPRMVPEQNRQKRGTGKSQNKAQSDRARISGQKQGKKTPKSARKNASKPKRLGKSESPVAARRKRGASSLRFCPATPGSICEAQGPRLGLRLSAARSIADSQSARASIA